MGDRDPWLPSFGTGKTEPSSATVFRCPKHVYDEEVKPPKPNNKQDANHQQQP